MIENYKVQIAAAEAGEDAEEEATSFPGYILLIDEPENCLHPMAVRAARNYLYGLAQDSNWPSDVIDPFALLHKSARRPQPRSFDWNVMIYDNPRTFRADAAKFSNDERQNLRALLQLDASLSEMFFGSYPVLVEGRHRVWAYIAAIAEKGNPLATQITVVNARGKTLLCPLIKLLIHFAVPFGVLHDTDYPVRSDGKANSAWTENEKIATYINDARNGGLRSNTALAHPTSSGHWGFPRAVRTNR